MTGLRIVTAIAIVLPVLGIVLLAPMLLFAGLVLLVVLLGAWEWSGLLGMTGRAQRGAYVLVIGVPVLALAGGFFAITATMNVVLVAALLWWAVVLVVLAGYEPGRLRSRPGTVLLWIAGPLTLIPAALALIGLQAAHPYLVLYLLGLVALADTGAYFVGRRFGKTALAPGISPGKTREGLLGAMLAAFALSVVVAWRVDWPPLEALVFVLLSMLVALISVAGDLLESVLKREAGAKDSGRLLPGHGGILDRIDSLTSAAPLLLLGLLWLELWPWGSLG